MHRYMLDEDGNSVRDYEAEEHDIDCYMDKLSGVQDYEHLKECMTEYRLGIMGRAEYMAAHHMFQRSNGLD